ncbi:hypothetical protein J3R83DRAFT_13400 [Lanmaoa asiatica]|nr:hypothetical protein J3R83DRAFT_13400 [Lanmaoa asiatica]
MIPFRPCSAHSYFVLFASLALVVLQNVTVDDVVLTGPVIPQYLPSTSYRNIGNNCSGCSVKPPDPSMAFDGTSCSYSLTTGVTQAISFNFTDIEFVLDGVVVSQYTRTPSATNDHRYNVPVYVNEMLASGEHTMMIQPINLGNQVLILFDYLIYSTDPSSSVSPSAQATSTLPPTSTMSTSAMSTSPLSPTSSGTQGTPSGQNIGVIVGGTVGGVAVLVLQVVAASLLCYRRYTRSATDRPPAEDGTVVDPFISRSASGPNISHRYDITAHLMGFPFAKVSMPPCRSI